MMDETKSMLGDTVGENLVRASELQAPYGGGETMRDSEFMR